MSAYLTPPEIAKQMRVTPAKIINFIRSGELAAINVAERAGGRPRWRISQQSLDAFLASRANRRPTKVVRRRKSPLTVTEFFG